MKFSIFQKGLTFIDVLVGISLMLIVFLGIFGAYRLNLKVVSHSKARITATAIANQKIEMVRNLPYEDVGVQGDFPDGVLEPTTTTTLNNLNYTIETRVDFVVDLADGVAAPDDDCPNDYKRVGVKVSWPGLFKGKVELFTDVAPKNLSEECATGGGILSVVVFDASGIMVNSPLIEVKDPATDAVIKSVTPASGQHYFSLATSTYKVVVSKSGYSTARTYGVGEVYGGQTIATPEKPHLVVLEGQLTEISFSIDKISTFSVNTLSPWGTDYWADSFEDQSKISESSNIIVYGGEVNLATTTEGYLSSGYLFSIGISPESLLNWDELTFTDSEPLDTDLKYQIYYASSTDWLLIPNSDLPGNSVGFDLSPVDLSGLDISKYSSLKLGADFSSNTTTSSPTLEDWQVSWITSIPTPIPNLTFNLGGEKLVGYDSDENPIYKYSVTSTSDGSGHVDLSDLEWDLYTFSVDPATGLDLVSTDPSPQPISLLPNTTQSIDLYLKAENSLLVTVQDAETLEPVFSASTTLSSATYEKAQFTDQKGQTYFIPLDQGDYNLNVSAEGYSATSTTVSVSGDETKTIQLELAE